MDDLVDGNPSLPSRALRAVLQSISRSSQSAPEARTEARGQIYGVITAVLTDVPCNEKAYMKLHTLEKLEFTKNWKQPGVCTGAELTEQRHWIY